MKNKIKERYSGKKILWYGQLYENKFMPLMVHVVKDDCKDKFYYSVDETSFKVNRGKAVEQQGKTSYTVS